MYYMYMLWLHTEGCCNAQKKHIALCDSCFLLLEELLSNLSRATITQSFTSSRRGKVGNEKAESTLHNITNMFVIQIESARQGQYKGAGTGLTSTCNEKLTLPLLPCLYTGYPSSEITLQYYSRNPVTLQCLLRSLNF